MLRLGAGTGALSFGVSSWGRARSFGSFTGALVVPLQTPACHTQGLNVVTILHLPCYAVLLRPSAVPCKAFPLAHVNATADIWGAFKWQCFKCKQGAEYACLRPRMLRPCMFYAPLTVDNPCVPSQDLNVFSSSKLGLTRELSRKEGNCFRFTRISKSVKSSICLCRREECIHRQGVGLTLALPPGWRELWRRAPLRLPRPPPPRHQQHLQLQPPNRPDWEPRLPASDEKKTLLRLHV